MNNNPDNFSLTFPETSRSVARGWMVLAISALAVSGLFALLLALSRTPGFQAIIPFRDFFHTALVTHVNLSILVWMLAFASVQWASVQQTRPNILDWSALISAILGTILFTIAPFISEGNPLQNNYIPILQNRIFFIGLALFGVGIFLNAALLIIRMFRRKYTPTRVCNITPSIAQKFGIYSSGIIVLMAMICFILSYKQLSPPQIRSLYFAEDFYELLFWGGGHVLQFAYLQAMLIAWLALAGSLQLKLKLSPNTAVLLFKLNAIIILVSPVAYFQYNITDFEHTDFFTMQMRHGGGVSAFIAGLLVTIGFFTTRKIAISLKPQRNALIWSIILFGAGGALGFMIVGTDTTTPAHYHGSIVGITMALMGLTYNILPKLGYGEVKGWISHWQPHLYGGGQLMHISGLAVSGGYGALRKTPGAMETIEAKISMGFMGAGALLATIGGLFFVIIAFTSIYKSRIVRKC